MAEAGYAWTELGPYGYLPTAEATLRGELKQRGLKLCGGAIGGDSSRSGSLAKAEATVERGREAAFGV